MPKMKIRQINHIVCVVVIYTMVAIAVTYFFLFLYFTYVE